MMLFNKWQGTVKNPEQEKPLSKAEFLKYAIVNLLDSLQYPQPEPPLTLLQTIKNRLASILDLD